MARGPVWSMAWASLACLWGMAACSSPGADESATVEEVAVIRVAVADLQRETWTESLDLTAELLPWAAVTVAAEAGGRIVDLPVEHGDRVRDGQTLARLESSGVEAELARAEAQLQSARAALEQAERDLTRGQALAESESGIVSASDVDQLLLSRDTRAAQVSEAKAAVRIVQKRLTDMVIRAPFSGVISERTVEKGSWVAEGQAVVRLVDGSRLKARASVSGADRLRLSLGGTAELRVLANPGSVYGAKLRFLGQEADTATGSFLVEAEVQPRSETGDGQLIAGLPGTLSVTLAEHEGLLVPATALLTTSAGEHVFVVEEDRAVRRPVITEPADGNRARIVSGLSAGDRLVVQGQHRLSDGAQVEVQAL